MIFNKLKEVEIRADGEEVRLVVVVNDPKDDSWYEVDVHVPARDLGPLINQLSTIWTSPQLRTPESPEPPLYIASDLEVFIDPPTGALRISLENPQGHRIRIGLFPEQAKKLYELMFRLGKYDNGEIH